MFVRFLFALVMVLTQGCSTTSSWIRTVPLESNESAPLLKVGVWTDAASGIRHYQGPLIPGAVADGTAYLMASEVMGQRGSGQVHLVVSMQQANWLFIDRASDAQGEMLQTTMLDRVIGSCVRQRHQDLCVRIETVSIRMPRDYLLRHTNGVRLLLAGQYGGYVVSMPGTYVRGFLAATP